MNEQTAIKLVSDEKVPNFGSASVSLKRSRVSAQAAGHVVTHSFCFYALSVIFSCGAMLAAPGCAGQRVVFEAVPREASTGFDICQADHLFKGQSRRGGGGWVES